MFLKVIKERKGITMGFPMQLVKIGASFNSTYIPRSITFKHILSDNEENNAISAFLSVYFCL